MPRFQIRRTKVEFTGEPVSEDKSDETTAEDEVKKENPEFTQAFGALEMNAREVSENGQRARENTPREISENRSQPRDIPQRQMTERN